MIRCRVCGNEVLDSKGLDSSSLAFCCRRHFRAGRAVLAASELDAEELALTLHEGHKPGLERLWAQNPTRTEFPTFDALVSSLLQRAQIRRERMRATHARKAHLTPRSVGEEAS